MKKHVLGVALFSLIVASFVLIYTFFYAPSIPPKNAVKPPISQTEIPEVKPMCYPKRQKDFSYETVSANYFAEQGRLVTKVKLYWNDDERLPPTKITVQPRIFSMDNYDKAINLQSETLNEPFADGNGKTFTIESKFVLSGLNDGPPNLYVVFDFADSASGNALMSEKSGLGEAFHVLYVYPESSVVKPKVKTFVPVRE